MTTCLISYQIINSIRDILNVSKLYSKNLEFREIRLLSELNYEILKTLTSSS